MKIDHKKDYVRCIPAFTIKPGTVSLISEENHKYYPKGCIVLQVSRETVYTMYHPHPGQTQVLCECKKIKSKGVEKIIAKIVLQGEFEE
jgi:hypothetical protein